MAFTLPGVNERGTNDRWWGFVNVRNLSPRGQRPWPDRPPGRGRGGAAAGPIAIPEIGIGGQIPQTDFERLLDRPLRQPVSDFERLLQRGPQTDFERLLDRTYNPRSTAEPVVARTGSLLAALARGSLLIGGLLYSNPAGAGSDRSNEPLPQTRPGRKGPPKRPRVTTRSPQPEPSVRTARPLSQPQPEPSVRSAPPELTLPEITLDPGPIVAPQPRLDPTTTASPQPSPLTLTFSQPLPRANPVFLSAPRPRPRPAPLALANPFPTVSPATVSPATVSQVEPRGLTAPLPNPLSFAQPQPSSPCSCSPSSKPSKKKRKKSEPRTVCYSGTYRERSRGINKQPRRKVPCQ